MRRRVIELSNGMIVRDQARGVYGFDGAAQQSMVEVAAGGIG
jgi:hypothetical protein